MPRQLHVEPDQLKSATKLMATDLAWLVTSSATSTGNILTGLLMGKVRSQKLLFYLLEALRSSAVPPIIWWQPSAGQSLSSRGPPHLI